MKYTINHTCGHSVERQLFGHNKDRDSKIEWLERQPCLDCLKIDEDRKRDEQNRAAAEANRAAGYRELSGSEKQVLWAESIRREVLDALGSIFEQVPDEAKSVWAKTSEWLKEQGDATWWIETIGTLKSSNGLAPLFSMLKDGRLPQASPAEKMREIMLISPHMNEQVADVLGIGQDFRQRVQAHLEAAAKAERRVELERSKPQRPAWLQAIVDESKARCGKYYWNGKIYSGGRIFVSEREIKLSVDQVRDLTEYQSRQAAWNKEFEAIN